MHGRGQCQHRTVLLEQQLAREEGWREASTAALKAELSELKEGRP